MHAHHGIEYTRLLRDIDADLERRRLKRLRSYASPGTIIEPIIPEDLGRREGACTTSERLRPCPACTTFWGRRLCEENYRGEHAGFDAVVQIAP